MKIIFMIRLWAGRRKTEHRESNEANKSGGAVRFVTVARRLFSGCKNAKRCCSLDSDFLR